MYDGTCELMYVCMICMYVMYALYTVEQFSNLEHKILDVFITYIFRLKNYH